MGELFIVLDGWLCCVWVGVVLEFLDYYDCEWGFFVKDD